MLLNSTTLQSIITNFSNDAIQQVGIDLRIKQINTLTLPFGHIPKEGKTVLPQYQSVQLDSDNVWRLGTGFYDIVFEEGCKIPSDVTLFIRQRSSLLRIGGLIQSSIFDPGFETDNIGCCMIIHRSVIIEPGARIAQIYGVQNMTVEEGRLYNGQFQNDKQRKK